MNAIAQEQETKLRKAIIEAVNILSESETGRAIGSQLRRFLEGRVSNADGRGWRSVDLLIAAYQHGLPGSVLEALEKFPTEGVT